MLGIKLNKKYQWSGGAAAVLRGQAPGDRGAVSSEGWMAGRKRGRGRGRERCKQKKQRPSRPPLSGRLPSVSTVSSIGLKLDSLASTRRRPTRASAAVILPSILGAALLDGECTFCRHYRVLQILQILQVLHLLAHCTYPPARPPKREELARRGEGSVPWARGGGVCGRQVNKKLRHRLGLDPEER